MCRLLGVVSRTPDVMTRLLADDLEPFLTLACEHGDGWGIAATRATGHIDTFKEPERADVSPRFGTRLALTVTDSALLHLRMASQQFAVTAGNSHPFGDHRAALAHNGDFTPATCLDDSIGPELLATAGGDTDSERLYLAVRRRIDAGLTPAKALAEVTEEIRARATEYVSLNTLLLTPAALYAYTDHDPDSEVIRRRGPGYFGLSARRDADRVVVASTGWPQPAPSWTPLPERRVVEIGRGDLTFTVH
jgi:predicted glutamine amidotransferase